MKPNKYVGLTLAVILVGVIAYFATKEEEPKPITPTEINAKSLNSAAGAQNTLADLMNTDGKACKFTIDATKGEVKAGKKQARIKLTAASTDPALPPRITNIIFDENNSYSWGEGQPLGIKVPIPKEGQPKSGPASFELDLERDFTCEDWEFKASEFELPAGLEFPDFSQFKQVPSTPPETK